MNRLRLPLLLVLGIGLCLQASGTDTEKGHGLQVLLSEVQPGTMASQQYCMLVFADHRFHAERANTKMGRDRERQVYEGELSDADWKALVDILDSEQFRKLRVTPASSTLVVKDAHSYNISVARDKEYQNLEFLDNPSRKPYEAQLKPLFQWWKAVRTRHMAQSQAPPDARCTLDSSRGVFAY